MIFCLSLIALSGFAHAADTPQVKRLTWAGVQIASDRSVVFIDAMATDIWDGKAPGGFVPAEAGDGRAFALITHAHNDHFDAAGLGKVLGERGYVICDQSIATYVASRGFRVIPARPYHPILRGGFVFTAVPAQDGFGDQQISWIISDGERKYFHAGDSLWHGHWASIGLQHGPFDIAFLPINGAVVGQDLPIDTPAVLTPTQAVDAALLLRAQVVVPIHFGFNDPPGYIEQADALEVFLDAAQNKGVMARHLAPGEVFSALNTN